MMWGLTRGGVYISRVGDSKMEIPVEKPGFQQDPVAETARGCLIGAHCTCPTRLAGFDQPPEPYFLSYHHGKRDDVPVPRWKLGQRVTVAELVVPTAKKKRR